MRLPARTNLTLAGVLVTLCTLASVLAPTSVQSEAPVQASERDSLKGIVGLEVLVEPLNLEIEQQGLTTYRLQQAVRQRLKKAGVAVLTEWERLATPAAALLTVRVDALHDRIGRFFYSVELRLAQRVRLKGSVAPELPAVTWMKPGGLATVADDNVAPIEDQVLRKVDQFITDYAAANPERRMPR